MLVITAMNPNAWPHWKRTRGGRPYFDFLSWRLGSMSISFQTLSVYFVRTSSPELNVSNMSARVMVDGSPPPNSYSARFCPLAGGALHLFFLVTPYSFGLKAHWTTTASPLSWLRMTARVWATCLVPLYVLVRLSGSVGSRLKCGVGGWNRPAGRAHRGRVGPGRRGRLAQIAG